MDATAAWKVILPLSLLLLVNCFPKSAENLSDEQTLVAQYGRKKLFLWNKSFQSKRDSIWRSCWYYKEAPPSLGLSERQALATSVRLNEYALHDGHVQKQLESIVREKLINIGAEFVPCGLASVSVGAAIASGGASAVAFGVSSAWMLNNCIKNTINISRLSGEFGGATEGLTSLELGELALGKTFGSKKMELDMFREAIRRARQLGLEDKEQCPKPNPNW